LLHTGFRLPKLNEVLHLWEVHKRNIVYMPIKLPFQDDSRRKALVAHAFRVRFVVRAVVVYFVRKGLNWSTVLTHLVWAMHIFALRFHFC